MSTSLVSRLSLLRRTIAIIAGVLIGLAAAPVASAPNPADLIELQRAGKIEVKINGANIQNVTVRVRKTGPDPLNVDLPVGLYFVSGDHGSQNMVSTSARTVRLSTDQWVTVSVPAACANKSKRIPGADNSFSVRRSPNQKELATAMPALAQAGASYAVIQAAVWVLTDNATFASMGSLVRRTSQFDPGRRVITEDDAGRALKILADAGINVKAKAIWKERRGLADGTRDEAIARWLRGA